MKKYLSIILFAFLGIIWGSNFIYMKWASEMDSSMQIVFLRVLFGFIPVLIYALMTQSIKLAHAKHILHFFVMSIIATVCYYYFFAKGSSLLYSGIAGALSAFIPIFSLVLALIFIAEEKLTMNRFIGVLMGFVGVVIMARPFSDGASGDLSSTNVFGVISMILGSLSVGASFIYAKKFISPLKIPAAALTTYQLGLSLILLALFTDFSSIEAIGDDTHVLIGVIVGLGILGTGVAYIIYYYIVDTLGAVAASSVTYLPPIVALFIGMMVGEKIIALDYLATALIMMGVYILNKKSKQTKIH